MDFYNISTKSVKKGLVEISPNFKVCRSKDLMIRGKSFYAVWDEEKNLWSTDEYDVARLIDQDLTKTYTELSKKSIDNIYVKYATSFDTNTWSSFKNYISKVDDNYHELDKSIVFSNTDISKTDYVSKKLPYPLQQGICDAYEEIMSTLYAPEERAKIEWAIGSIIAGDSKKIQKFIVLYGAPGTGKSTVLEIIQKLFEGYYATFEAKALTSSTNIFATEAFKNNPLIAIQHDGDLSKIEDNSKLNSIVSHEDIIVNEKYKSAYSIRSNCFLFMATNKPVKITDAKAGLIRRLIDVMPTGNKIPADRFFELKDKLQFELGAIAYRCLDVYKTMGKDYYNKYRPINMMFKTDPFYNFMEDIFPMFLPGEPYEDGISLKAAYRLYNEYCNETNLDYKLQQYKFREEFMNYFAEFHDRYTLPDGSRERSFFKGFLRDKIETNRKNNKVQEPAIIKAIPEWLQMSEQDSVLDGLLSDCKAQLANDKGTPAYTWDNCRTTLKDLDTHNLHYVKPDQQHIVIDFDLKDETGAKSLDKNLEAASKFMKTYAEVSKSGSGIHLHYIYDGDVDTLSREYDDNIEIKVFKGGSSLRRALSKCNSENISTISCGLPLRAVKKGADFNKIMLDLEGKKFNDYIIKQIKKNLNKEYHAYTKPSIDFIKKILDEAYDSGKSYDVSFMRPSILAFAAGSTNQASSCIKLVNEMHFGSDDQLEKPDDSEAPICFYDVEVFPNLFLVNYKFADKPKVYRMINPKPSDIESLCKYRLVGYNCRRYDNHILYGCLMGFNNIELYALSQRIINKCMDAYFPAAYNLSYADIYDFAAKKQSLKKWEIELGIHHLELGLPWDQPVPEEQWERVAKYCDNDVISTEVVWNHLQQDFIARKILSDLSGLPVNATTRQHVTKFIFGDDKNPELEYTHLEDTFPGYEFKDGHNIYRGIDMGFGGYVYAEPGMYTDVALLDIESLHPHSIKEMNCFGVYTERFVDILNARLDIKHKDFEAAKKRLGGVLAPYLSSPEQAAALSYALKIIINSVYGYTSATFANPFKDPRNKNNIVALRGALFMKTLQDEVVKRGFTVAHIKTDSIKIPNATPEIIEFCKEFAAEYGYKFEHEATYDRMCLVNDAVYIAKYNSDSNINGDKINKWTATGEQFQVPYVFKKLFTHEDIEFDDMCETKQVSSADIYIDFDEDLPDVTHFENLKQSREDVSNGKQVTKKAAKLVDDNASMSPDELDNEIAKGHSYQFVGKIGRFSPIKAGCGGGKLLRCVNGKYTSVNGAKDYRWKESESIKDMSIIDKTYYNKLVNDAFDAINAYGDAEWFINN